jgi:hypothetical protein
MKERERYIGRTCQGKPGKLVLNIGIVQIRCNRKQTANSVALVRERTIPTERASLIGEVSANFYGRILGFLDRSR